MAASHMGEDKHVRTLQAVFRRAGVSQSLLTCGSVGMPMDKVTAMRLARDGEAPGAIRHQCSGFHAASILLSRFSDWSLEDYDQPEHPSQQAVRTTVARVFGVDVDELDVAMDDCGLATYAFPLVDVARAYALLADPASASDPVRSAMAPALTRVRDAMTGAPEMVGGTDGSLDTMLMQQLKGKVVSKGGAEGSPGRGVLPGGRGAGRPAVGLAVRIDDGDGYARANRAVTMEALSQLGWSTTGRARPWPAQHRPVTRSAGRRRHRGGDPRLPAGADLRAGIASPSVSGMRGAQDPYRELGVPRGATDEQVKAAHRRLAKRYHPDGADGDQTRFLAVQEAYLLLSDPVRRRDWDSRHAPGPVRATERPVAPRPPSPPAAPTAGRPPTNGGPTAQRGARPAGIRGRRPRSAPPVAATRGPQHDLDSAGRPMVGGLPRRWCHSGWRPADRWGARPPFAPGSGAPEGPGPRPGGPTAGGTQPPSQGPGAGDIYSRSSGAAWSSAARRHFRKDDADLPRGGQFRYRGTQVVTGAEARQDAAAEARRSTAQQPQAYQAPRPAPPAHPAPTTRATPTPGTGQRRVPVSPPQAPGRELTRALAHLPA